MMERFEYSTHVRPHNPHSFIDENELVLEINERDGWELVTFVQTDVSTGDIGNPKIELCNVWFFKRPKDLPPLKTPSDIARWEESESKEN